eukprot:TRINITY_DN19435_c0_g1_i1.p2 TRINITY_DN19435_c0_g1~~TRINITY_DN19435_c0_g1_i1.p2  ORF type:complete len:649 (+),score=112.10 TRINITY_DN19435_c0_g1_i1:84-1949(+)
MEAGGPAAVGHLAALEDRVLGVEAKIDTIIGLLTAIPAGRGASRFHSPNHSQLAADPGARRPPPPTSPRRAAAAEPPAPPWADQAPLGSPPRARPALSVPVAAPRPTPRSVLPTAKSQTLVSPPRRVSPIAPDMAMPAALLRCSPPRSPARGAAAVSPRRFIGTLPPPHPPASPPRACGGPPRAALDSPRRSTAAASPRRLPEPSPPCPAPVHAAPRWGPVQSGWCVPLGSPLVVQPGESAVTHNRASAVPTTCLLAGALVAGDSVTLHVSSAQSRACLLLSDHPDGSCADRLLACSGHHNGAPSDQRFPFGPDATVVVSRFVDRVEVCPGGVRGPDWYACPAGKIYLRVELHPGDTVRLVARAADYSHHAPTGPPPPVPVAAEPLLRLAPVALPGSPPRHPPRSPRRCPAPPGGSPPRSPRRGLPGSPPRHPPRSPRRCPAPPGGSPPRGPPASPTPPMPAVRRLSPRRSAAGQGGGEGGLAAAAAAAAAAGAERGVRLAPPPPPGSPPRESRGAVRRSSSPTPSSRRLRLAPPPPEGSLSRADRGWKLGRDVQQSAGAAAACSSASSVSSSVRFTTASAASCHFAAAGGVQLASGLGGSALCRPAETAPMDPANHSIYH